MSKPLPKAITAKMRISRERVEVRPAVLTEADFDRIELIVTRQLSRAIRNLSLRSSSR